MSRLRPYLKPCPFCGCARIEISADVETRKNGHVWCHACEAEIHGETEETVVANWNHRITESDPG